MLPYLNRPFPIAVMGFSFFLFYRIRAEFIVWPELNSSIVQTKINLIDTVRFRGVQLTYLSLTPWSLLLPFPFTCYES